MANTLKDTESNIISGLGTFTYTVPSSLTGIDFISVQSTVQTVPSSLSIVINQNGSPIATSATPAAAQFVINLQVTNVVCALNDVFTIVLSSSAASDNLPSAVSSLVVITKTIN